MFIERSAARIRLVRTLFVLLAVLPCAGLSFGYGTKFPEKYQRALYICDWTFGTMYAIHLEPEGSTYKGVKQEFVARTPLPLTDMTVGKDGAPACRWRGD